jgi:hypothetical protein
VEEAAQQRASSGGVSNRNAARWRRERKQRHALIVIAVAMVEVVASIETVAGQQQWRPSSRNATMVVNAIFQVVYSNILGVTWYIQIYTGKGHVVYLNIHISAQSVYTSPTIFDLT